MKTKTEVQGEIKGLGSIPNPPDPRRIRLAQFQQPVALPRKYKTDISMLPVRDQKALGSCVGQTHAELIQFFEYKETGKIVPVSARHIYARCKALDGYGGEGTYPVIAAKVITEEGAATTRTVPDDSDMSHADYINVPVTDEVKKDAYPRRVKPGFAEVALDIESIKQAIYQNKVVAGALQVGNWSKEPLSPQPDRGGHDILFFGFEELRNGDHKLFFRNHWSEDWMDEGDGEILYSLYQGELYDFMAFTDIPNELLEEAKKKPYLFTRLLKYRSQGLEVRYLQERLIKMGLLKRGNGTLYEKSTGYFGRDTERAVQQYQCSRGIVCSGTASKTGYGTLGPKTRLRLNQEAQEATTGAAAPLAGVKKVIVVNAGHHDTDPGATGYVERDEAKKIRDLLVKDLSAAGFTVHAVPDNLDLAKSIAWANAKVPTLNDGLCIDIHLNANANHTASGTEAYYGTSETGRVIAAAISAALAKELGTKDRGAKTDTEAAATELGWIRKTKGWASLIEVAFITNAGDMNLLTGPGGYQRASNGITTAVNALYGVQPVGKLEQAKKLLRAGLDLLDGV